MIVMAFICDKDMYGICIRKYGFGRPNTRDICQPSVPEKLSLNILGQEGLGPSERKQSTLQVPVSMCVC